MMELKVIVPGGTVLRARVSSISAPGTHGSFGVLPRHIDWVAVLVQGILAYVPEAADDRASTPAEELERYVALDGGVLVKRGERVVVATQNAVTADRLEDVENAVAEMLHTETERERDARAVLFRIETDVVQRMLELEER